MCACVCVCVCYIYLYTLRWADMYAQSKEAWYGTLLEKRAPTSYMYVCIHVYITQYINISTQRWAGLLPARRPGMAFYLKREMPPPPKEGDAKKPLPPLISIPVQVCMCVYMCVCVCVCTHTCFELFESHLHAKKGMLRTTYFELPPPPKEGDAASSNQYTCTGLCVYVCTCVCVYI